MATDIKTIAQMLGVSTTTVSRALSNSGRLSGETRAKVIKLAAELDYRPNSIARELRSRKSATIGIIAMGITGSFYAGIMEGIEALAGQNGYSVLLACSNGYPDKEVRHLDLFREKRVDGIIVAPSHPSENIEYYRRLKDTGLPFVFIDRHIPALDTDYVTTDNVAGAYKAAMHLAALGRKKIAFLSTNKTERKATSVIDRFTGYTAGLEESGLKLDVIIGEDTPNILPQEEFSRMAVTNFLKTGQEIDGLFAVNDSLAVGAMMALKEGGIRVPDDVSVIGFDDSDLAAYFQPSLTTLRQQNRLIGEQAMSLLFERISGSRDEKVTRHVKLVPELIVRQSCGSGLIRKI